MSQKIREEMLPRLRQRYAEGGREGRSKLIDELCEQFGYSRKDAIKLMGARPGRGGNALVRKGRPPLYGEAEYPCGKRLAQMRELMAAALRGSLWEA